MATAVHPSEQLSLPERASLALPAAIVAGDLDAATSCFARDACFVTPDDTAVQGREAIRPVLSLLVAAGVEIEVEGGPILLAGDVAWGSERWQIAFRGGDGRPVRQTSTANMVLRRQENRWALAIAAPWGWPTRA